MLGGDNAMPVDFDDPVADAHATAFCNTASE
jgi:hypothetical protein